MSEENHSNDQKIAAALGLSPVAPIEGEVVVVPPKATAQGNETNVDEDYELVRDNFKILIDTSYEAAEGILKIAQESDSPRAYEVASDLLKTAMDANTKLLAMHKQYKDLKKDAPEKTETPADTGSIMNTHDLLKHIREQQNTK